jgi:hypothetical protein
MEFSYKFTHFQLKNFLLITIYYNLLQITINLNRKNTLHIQYIIFLDEKTTFLSDDDFKNAEKYNDLLRKLNIFYKSVNNSRISKFPDFTERIFLEIFI